MARLDLLFAERPRPATDLSLFGEFTFDGEVPTGRIAEFYDLPVTAAERLLPLADFVQARLGRAPAVGDHVRVADVELVVQWVRRGRIARIGIELEPDARAHPLLVTPPAWLRNALGKLRRRSRPASR